jgi:hypothetical protein
MFVTCMRCKVVLPQISMQFRQCCELPGFHGPAYHQPSSSHMASCAASSSSIISVPAAWLRGQPLRERGLYPTTPDDVRRKYWQRIKNTQDGSSDLHHRISSHRPQQGDEEGAGEVCGFVVHIDTMCIGCVCLYPLSSPPTQNICPRA